MNRPACISTERVAAPCSGCRSYPKVVHIASGGFWCADCCPVCKPLPHLEPRDAVSLVEQAGLFGGAK